MVKIAKRTLKSYANWIYKRAIDEKRAIIEYEFKGYKEVPFGYNSFREFRPSHGCDKLIIYAYYVHNDWSPPTKEVYSLLYRPK